jgi:S-adenosylmethionine hydrolase
MAPRECRLVNVIHEVPRDGVLNKTIALAHAMEWFLREIARSVVINPGVGKGRRTLISEPKAD